MVRPVAREAKARTERGIVERATAEDPAGGGAKTKSFACEARLLRGWAAICIIHSQERNASVLCSVRSLLAWRYRHCFKADLSPQDSPTGAAERRVVIVLLDDRYK